MKKISKSLVIAALLALTSQMGAQEVNTTQMLTMAPQRHYFNPAFQPITDGYVYLPLISRTNFSFMNNSLTMSDLIFEQNGQTITALHPESQHKLLDALRPNTLFRANMSTSLLGFGFRMKHDDYLHVGIDMTADAGINLPRDLMKFALEGMANLEGNNNFNLKSLGMNMQAYTSLSIGYSRQHKMIGWGAKVKMLMGAMYAGMTNQALALDASPERWTLMGTGNLRIAGPLNFPANLNGESITEWAQGGNFLPSQITEFLKPSGMGVAADLGITITPHKMVTISASMTDLGGIFWNKGRDYKYQVNGNFEGIGSIDTKDYLDNEGVFSTDILMDTITTRLTHVYQNALTQQDSKDKFFAPLTMKFNVGVDANFFDNLLGVGLYSRTMLYNKQWYEEVTLGAAVRPTSWFNASLSYSFLNGRWSNFGAAIGLRGGPIALTLAADYIPTWYANGIPYKTPGLNMEMGLAIVWGWKKKAEKKQD
ncbi:MAG: DUF5723 family protein [Paludibacteraceae bacterium]|nr:DUF5723 family protein [Paludibacteraceae bacterium]